MDAAGDPTGFAPSAPIRVERKGGGFLVEGRGERRHYMDAGAAFRRARELAGWAREASPRS